MPGFFVTAKELATAAVTFNKAKYDEVTGKARECLTFCSWETADKIKAFPHALGRVPVGFSVVSIGKAGTVYIDDLPVPFDKFNVALKCSSATWAVVALR